jgi:hypothetical protein
MYFKLFSGFRRSLLFIVDVNSVLGYLHQVDVGSVADFSDLHGASVFMVEAFNPRTE